MSPIRTARPYAAKAIVEHEFDTNHLNIWVTFRFTMDQDVKPADNLWLCEVDDVLKAVTASAWQDAWTILLTVPAIAAIPDRVTLEYDGPDENLRITWGKQWEPWGPILSSDSSLLAYGSFKGNGFVWVQACAINTWYQISDVGITEGTTHKMTFQNNQELKIAEAGMYILGFSICLECAVAGKHSFTSILVNGVSIPVGKMHHQFGRANEEVAIAGHSLINLTVDKLVGIGIMCPDAGNPNFTVKSITLVVHKVSKN